MRATIAICITLCLMIPVAVMAQTKSHDLTADASLSWRFVAAESESDSLEMIITKRRPGWLGVGFGKGMISAEIVLIERNPKDKSKLVVKTCYLAGYEDPICDGIAQSWKVNSAIANKSYFQLNISRNTGRIDLAHGKDIKQGLNDMLYAYTDNDLVEFHDASVEGGSFGTVSLDLKQGSTDLSLKWGFIRHEYMMFIIWVFVADFLIFLALYCKWVPYWRFWHLAGFTIVFFLSYNAAHAGQSNWRPVDIPAFEKEVNQLTSHKSCAFYLKYLSLFQLLLGMFLEIIHFLPVGTLGRQSRWYIRICHMVLGCIVWLVARLGTFFGVKLYMVKFNDLSFMAILVIETFAFVFGIVLMQFNRSKEQEIAPEEYSKLVELDHTYHPQLDTVEKTLECQAIVQDIRKGKSQKEHCLAHPGKLIVVYDNRVYDMTGFRHPGGMQNIEEANWTDVSRYLIGVTGIEKRAGDLRKHSRNAFYELETRFIGMLYEKNRDLDDHWTLRNRVTGHVDFAKELFSFKEKEQLSQTTAIFKFENQKFNVATNLKGIRWIGRHYLLSVPTKSNKVRIYSQCQSYASEVASYNKALVQHFHRVINGQQSQGVGVELPQAIQSLHFTIKAYEDDQALSRIIHDLAPGAKVLIDGPYGTGLPLTEDLRGDVLLVAGGTGFIPFVDLLAFLLKKAMAMVLSRSSRPADFLQPSQDYIGIFRDCRFTLACSFQNKDDFVFYEIIQQLVKINDDHGLDFFRCFLRVDGATSVYGLPTVKGYFDEKFLEARLQELPNLQRVLICGPDRMNTAVYNALTRKLAVDEGKISFV
jgi:NAD(P)H-flavin reductase